MGKICLAFLGHSWPLLGMDSHSRDLGMNSVSFLFFFSFSVISFTYTKSAPTRHFHNRLLTLNMLEKCSISQLREERKRNENQTWRINAREKNRDLNPSCVKFSRRNLKWRVNWREKILSKYNGKCNKKVFMVAIVKDFTYFTDICNVLKCY